MEQEVNGLEFQAVIFAWRNQPCGSRCQDNNNHYNGQGCRKTSFRSHVLKIGQNENLASTAH
jgi:hypothetical protein